MHTGKKSSGDTEHEESVPQSYSVRKSAESSWERHHLSAGNVETVLVLAPTLLDTRKHTLERSLTGVLGLEVFQSELNPSDSPKDTCGRDALKVS